MEVRRRVQEARQADQKTIQELAAEVKRLVALLPREKIERDEMQIKADESSDNISLSGERQDVNRPLIKAEDTSIVTSTQQVEVGFKKIPLWIRLLFAVFLMVIPIVTLLYARMYSTKANTTSML
ncbi:hypothetical protein EON65_04860 [archaeon]|nr:MAG: hypothetical protein EON65_04860 [archaeon]